MKLSELIDRAVTLLRLVAAKSTKQAPEAELILEELLQLKGWAYPYLTTADIVKVVRCKKCRYYKKYKKKNDRKSQPFWACSLTMIKRPEDFYCAEGKGHSEMEDCK